MPKAPTTPPKFNVPLATQAAVNAPVTNPPKRNYFEPATELPQLPQGNLAKCLELWGQLQRYWKLPNLSPRWRDFIRELRQHTHAIQQGLPTVHTDQQEIERARGVAIVSGEARRQDRLAVLKSALADGVFSKLGNVPGRSIDPALFAFLSTPEAMAKVAALRNALAAYEVAHLEDFIYHSTSARSQEHKLCLASNPTQEKIEAVRLESDVLANPHFKDICAAKCSLLSRQWRETVKPLEVDLLQSALAFLADRKAEAVASEAAFFELHDLPRVETPVCRKYDALIADVQHALHSMTSFNPIAAIGPARVPSPNAGPMQNVFGLDVLSAEDLERVTEATASEAPAPATA